MDFTDYIIIALVILANILFFVAILEEKGTEKVLKEKDATIKAVIESAELVLQETRRQRNDAYGKINDQAYKIRLMAKQCREGVFFDKQNNTIVTSDNLERIGDL